MEIRLASLASVGQYSIFTAAVVGESQTCMLEGRARTCFQSTGGTAPRSTTVLSILTCMQSVEYLALQSRQYSGGGIAPIHTLM